MFVGFVLRVLPLILWTSGACTRDECTYRQMAQDLVNGLGLTAPEGWLWAPGHPVMMAICLKLTGTVQTVKGVEVAAGVLSIVLMYELGRRLGGVKIARASAILYAIHPTLIYFCGTLWSEVFYSTLLLGAVLSFLWARDGRWQRALLPGFLVGICVLFRGVATYMAPVFAIAIAWPDALPVDAAARSAREVVAAVVTSFRQRWLHSVAVFAAIVLTVAPYTIHATAIHGGLVISDATMGQMLWLGDNDFEPLTFDWGNGLLEAKAMDPTQALGRAHCDKDLPSALWNKCETQKGIDWIKAHPSEFVRRIPMRVAQMMNPNSFLTRHVRWDKWPGLPWQIKEGLCAYVILTSLLLILGGTTAAWARARGPYGILSAGIVVYHVAAIAVLAGLTRYRVPLEPLWMIYAAGLLTDPRGTMRQLVARPWRIVGAVVTLILLVPLVAWYLPLGFVW